MSEPRGFGYKPDPADVRDRLLARRPGLTRIAERRMDLLVTRIRDQGQTSSCVGHACVAAVELLHALESRPVPNLSPAHAYWLGRAQDGFQNDDAGSFIRSCIKGLRKVGCCGETDWPLDRARINDRPSLTAELSGIRFADLSYERVASNAEAVIDALQLGFPTVIGMEVGSVFVDHLGDDTIAAPGPREVLGGHAILACGYDRSGERFRIANSWSRGWGAQGFAWMESGWLERPTSGDFWALCPKQEEAV